MIRGKFTLAIFLLTAPAVSAQYSRADMIRVATDRFDMVVTTLNLRADQESAIKPLLLSKYIDIGQVKDVYRGSDKSASAKKNAKDSLKAIDAKYDGQINAILTPEQAKEWKRMQRDWRDDLVLPKS